MGATKDRLYSGLYECTKCDARYNVEDATEDELYCDECGSAIEIEDDDEADEDDEDDEEAA